MQTIFNLVLLSGGLAGGFISGLAGFGTGLMALGIWLYVLEPNVAATLVLICSVVSQTQTISTVWHAINPKRVWPMLVTGLLGVPVGVSVLAYVDPDVFRLSMGILLITYSVFMLLGRFQPRLAWGGRMADAVVGLVGGVLGGLAGLSGPLPTIWATLRGWTKDERRGVFQAYNLTVLAGALGWHAGKGFVTAQVLWLAAIALPGTVVGAWLGARTCRQLSDKRFHVIVLGLLAVSGLTLLWSRL